MISGVISSKVYHRTCYKSRDGYSRCTAFRSGAQSKVSIWPDPSLIGRAVLSPIGSQQNTYFSNLLDLYIIS